MCDMNWKSMEDSLASKKNQLRRSVSSFEFNLGSSSAGVREAKSFTGALQELKTGNKQIAQQQHDPNYYMKMMTEHQVAVKEKECITKEVSSDKIFVVKHEMLNYRGTQYTMSDIATRWKKDCRMWLWKGSFHRKRNKSMTQVCEKVQKLRLQASSEIVKHVM